MWAGSARKALNPSKKFSQSAAIFSSAPLAPPLCCHPSMPSIPPSISLPCSDKVSLARFLAASFLPLSAGVEDVHKCMLASKYCFLALVPTPPMSSLLMRYTTSIRLNRAPYSYSWSKIAPSSSLVPPKRALCTVVPPIWRCSKLGCYLD